MRLGSRCQAAWQSWSEGMLEAGQVPSAGRDGRGTSASDSLSATLETRKGCP